MKDKRPTNLDISTIALPVTAYTSIMHRISGVILFVGSFVLLFGLEQSLSSERQFLTLQECLHTWWGQISVWAGLSVLGYHMLAGCKHLLMDIGIGESLRGGITMAWTTIALAFLWSLAVAGWLLW